MDDFATLSLSLASLEDPHSLSASFTPFEDSSSSSSRTPSFSYPPVNEEYMNGNGSYSWCTIA
ncbi:hypothetical protein C8Q76DRAFT_754897 [Earliella scabrosa]|nr:hypothetical protein C8Q76DRAFT_754897 [Earliella scabrosa]